MNIEWLNDYGFGSNPDEASNKPPFEKVLIKLDEVHKKAIQVLKNTKDEELEEQNHISASFGGKNTKQAVIMHAIRHEPMHIGQISWILKLSGIKMV
jgi:uncharacterized damage-inducible protein DinB